MLRRLHRTLQSARQWLEAPHESSSGRYVLKAFTDNIIIGWPVWDDAESEFGRAFRKLAAFQLEMATEGFFIKGALSLGEAYIDDIAVFGKALTEAYTGESTVARDPRIILTKSAVNAVKQHLSYYSRPKSAPHVRDILQDSDGQWFLNYLDRTLMAVDEFGPDYDMVAKHKLSVEEKLNEYKNTPLVWSKYAWVAEYHNHFCDIHPDHFDDCHKIDVKLFRAPPRLIVD